MWRSETKAKNITSTFHPNVIYDSAGELHVMIQHVDQGFVQQCVIQKYCSETEKRQQRRSITPRLHIVHSGILRAATASTPTTSQQNHPPPLSMTCNKNMHSSQTHFTHSYCLKK